MLFSIENAYCTYWSVMVANLAAIQMYIYTHTHVHKLIHNEKTLLEVSDAGYDQYHEWQ